MKYHWKFRSWLASNDRIKDLRETTDEIGGWMRSGPWVLQPFNRLNGEIRPSKITIKEGSKYIANIQKILGEKSCADHQHRGSLTGIWFGLGCLQPLHFQVHKFHVSFASIPSSLALVNGFLLLFSFARHRGERIRKEKKILRWVVVTRIILDFEDLTFHVNLDLFASL